MLQNFIYFFKRKHILLSIYIVRERYGQNVLGDSEEKSMSLVFAWDLRGFISSCVWCPVRYPGTGQNKDRA